ncbi:HAD-IIA family hydrolase [Clostridioides difficile]|nr:HAD-IIA family hydrolase [Clostridioides difficile]
MTSISDIKCFLLDMDGTFYLGDKIIEGAIDFLELLEAQDKQYLFLTNNSSKNKHCYQEKLKKLGCDVSADKIFTSGEATTIYLNKLKPNAKVFLLGTSMLEEEFKLAGFELVTNREKSPDYIVLGFDTTLTYNKLWMACDFIREGKPYIATHPDYNCPLDGGKFMPDAGAIIDLIAASTGKRPYIVGKPNPEIIDAICNKYGYVKDEIAMIGDRLYTDIKTGIDADITSVLVLSGETSILDYKNSEIKATYVFPSLKEIAKELKIIKETV